MDTIQTSWLNATITKIYFVFDILKFRDFRIPYLSASQNSLYFSLLVSMSSQWVEKMIPEA